MKTMKVALLATAALAAVSVSARADDAAAIKAQLEALTARIAQLEAAPAVPVGFSLLTVSEGTQTVVPGVGTSAQQIAREGDKATIIGVLPTADAPASTTIEWSGYILAAITYYDVGDNASEDETDVDVSGRAQIKVVGKTDTAIGEVGVQIRMRADYDGEQKASENPVWLKEGWGWWAMTPELTLGGGLQASLGNIGYGYDGACSCYWATDGADVDLNPGDTSQMRLSYASGPISAAIALEDASGDSDGRWGGGDSLGVAAEVKYSGDTFNGEISGIWRDGGDFSNRDDFYQVGAGVGFSLGDMFALSVGAAMGQTVFDQDYWAATILASMNLSDTTHIELGYGHKEYDDVSALGWSDYSVDGFLAGVYWDPVDQLTIGVEGEYIDDENNVDEVMSIGLITVYRF